MTDSESDSSNVFAFQNVNTTVSAKGPNTNITNLSFRNQLTSTMCMPRNRPRYAESTYDQRSMYYRRETSPMSIHSACDIRPRNFQQYYPGMSSQRSVFNGRSGSPMSMRSMDSTASVSAADIVFAFKNVKFNKYDLKVIKEAYHKLMKQRVRKRIEKKRNMRLFLKGRRRSGYDSGEQGSDSSISSDDGRSVKTYKENMFSSRSARIDLTDFRKTVGDSNMIKDCSDNLRQNNFRNMFSIGSRNINQSQSNNNSMIPKQDNSLPTQKDRFKNGFLLPSQRFNRSVASVAIPENTERIHKNVGSNGMSYVKNHYAQNKHNESGTEDDEIFTENPIREKSIYAQSQGKRSLDSDDDSNLPEKKKSKISSPSNKQTNKVSPKQKNSNNINMNNFEFAKPTLPVRKSKPRVQEKLIAKSAQPLAGFVEPIINKIPDNVELSQPATLNEKSNDYESQSKPNESMQSDISMQPSFMKRKLFTQTLDVTEKANLSDTNSPQSSVYTLQKEKNKARKLVTNQSCLNREVNDDSNLLDLIHKIVPPDRINLTNQTSINQSKAEVNNKSKKDEGKWDVTSVLSMCNEEDVSDTYTDEEIFVEYNEKDNNQLKSNKETKSKSEKQKTVGDKKKENGLINKNKQSPKTSNKNVIEKQIVNQDVNLASNSTSKNCIKSSVKSFWDTDLESDVEGHTTLPRTNLLNNIEKANADMNANMTNQELKKPVNCTKNLVLKIVPCTLDLPKKLNNITINSNYINHNNTYINNTLDSMRKFNTSALSIRTHRNSNKKKCMNETCIADTKFKPDKQNNHLDDKKKDISNGSNKKNVEKTKAVTEAKSIDTPKSKSKNDKRPRKEDTSHTKKNSPENKNTKYNKKVENPKSKNKSDLKPNGSPKNKNTKPNKEVENIKNKNKLNSNSSQSKPKSETVKSKAKSKPDKLNKSTADKKKDETQSETKQKLNTKFQGDSKINKKETEKNKSSKSKGDCKNTGINGKNNIKIKPSTSSNLNNSIEASSKNDRKSERPMRACRNSSQNRTIELSRTSQLNTTADINKSLRSRVINLSSSIENITLQIKPKNKAINKNFSHINTRKSDVSFSLGSNRQTPTPKKSIARRKR